MQAHAAGAIPQLASSSGAHARLQPSSEDPPLHHFLPKQKEEKNVFNLPTAPTFYPTEEEFRDPITYIEKIRLIGLASGIVKICPPPSYKPSIISDILYKRDSPFLFKTRTQSLGMLDGKSRSQLKYSQQLYKFHMSERGVVFSVPNLNGKLLDMSKLAALVRKAKLLGEELDWTKIAIDAQVELAFVGELPKIYNIWIAPFEEWMPPGSYNSTNTNDEKKMKATMKSIQTSTAPAIIVPSIQNSTVPLGAKEGTAAASSSNSQAEQNLVPHVINEMEHNEERGESNITLPVSNIPSLSNDSNEQTPAIAVISIPDDDDSSVDLSTYSTSSSEIDPVANDASLSESEDEDAQMEAEGESDEFSLNAGASESDTDNATDEDSSSGFSSPRRRKRFRPLRGRSHRGRLPANPFSDSDDHVFVRRSDRVPRPIESSPERSPSPRKQRVVSPTKKVSRKPLPPKEILTEGDETCIICNGEGTDSDPIIICDDCAKAMHLRCSSSTLKEVPDRHWACRDCIFALGANFGFEDNKDLRNINKFKEFADNFKAKIMRATPGPSEEQVEGKFWELLGDPFTEVDVEYGADLHTSSHGSGFPDIKRHPQNPYSFSPWNLNNIATIPGSLLRNITTNIAGLMVPWIYVGMVFSSFCWHFEDHYSYSINYNHLGAAKTWYGIPGECADGFEKTIREENKDLFDKEPDLLFHLTTLISPETLIKNGVKVVMTHQRPGEFIITFPRAYHAGFNQGFNVAEAVNLAPTDWLLYGSECIRLYSKFKKPPVFCHEELLLFTVQSQFSLVAATSLCQALYRCRQEEYRKRASILLRANYSARTMSQRLPSSDINQCAICNAFCYLSQIVCGSAQCSKVACIDHYDSKFCDCIATSKKFLEIRHTAAFLDALQLKADAIAKGMSQLRISSSKAVVQSAATASASTKEEWHQKCKQCLANMKSLGPSYSESNAKVKIDLDNLYFICEDLISLNFNPPDARKFHQLLEEAKELEFSIEIALKSENIEEIDKVCARGKECMVEIPLMKQARFKKKQLTFLMTHASSLSSIGRYSLDSVEKMIQQARHMRLDDFCSKLTEACRLGRKLDEKMTNYLSAPYVSDEFVLSLAPQLERCPVSLMNQERFQVALQKINHFHLSLFQIMPLPLVEYPMEVSSLLQRNCTEDQALHLFQASSQAGIQLIHLIGALRECVSWKEMIVYRLRISEPLDSFILKMKEDIYRISSNTAMECICQTYATEYMINCGVCSMRFHLECVHIKSTAIPKSFTCPCCNQYFQPNPFKKMKIDDLKSLVLLALNFKLYPREAMELGNMLLRLEVWLNELDPYLESLESPQDLRHWLKKLYGLFLFTPQAEKLERRLSGKVVAS